jgi:hypothetical protein
MRRLPEYERLLRECLNAFGPAPREELLRVLTLSGFERAAGIGEFHSNPRTRALAELLIDLEEDRYARAVVVGLLREKRT